MREQSIPTDLWLIQFLCLANKLATIAKGTNQFTHLFQMGLKCMAVFFPIQTAHLQYLICKGPTFMG